MTMTTQVFLLLCLAAEVFLLDCLIHFSRELRALRHAGVQSAAQDRRILSFPQGRSVNDRPEVRRCA